MSNSFLLTYVWSVKEGLEENLRNLLWPNNSRFCWGRIIFSDFKLSPTLVETASVTGYPDRKVRLQAGVWPENGLLSDLTVFTFCHVSCDVFTLDSDVALIYFFYHI